MAKYYFVPPGKNNPKTKQLLISSTKIVRGIVEYLKKDGATKDNTIIFNAPPDNGNFANARLSAILLVSELECKHGEEQRWLRDNEITIAALTGEIPNDQTLPTGIAHVVFVTNIELLEDIAEEHHLEYVHIPGGNVILVIDTAARTCNLIEITNS